MHLTVHDAVILAAGRGVRLDPITQTRPKPLIPILGNPLLIHILKVIRDVGIVNFHVVVNYMKDMVRNTLLNYAKHVDVNINIVEQGEELGTAHAVSKVREFVSGRFLLVYGDLFILNSLPISAIVSSHGDVAVGVVRVTDPWNYGVVVTDGFKVMDIVEKPKQSNTLSSVYVNTGIYLLNSKIFNYIDNVKPSPRGELELTDAIKLAIKDGGDVRAIHIPEGYWMDVGKPWSVIDVNKALLQGMMDRTVRGDVEGNVVIKGPIHIGDGSIIKSGTYIEGPAYIGENCEVGPNTYIRPYTVLCSGVKAGSSVEVKESVVMENAKLPHLNYVGDSVVCEDVNLGAGTITANFRFDEGNVKMNVKGEKVDTGRKKLGAIIGGHVRTGINVSIMPGVKIGAWSWIYPGIVVYRDIPSNSIVKHLDEVLTVKK
jgi:bifunctional UDP-N-acetylglucosamine pyrophosphorylase/glucosamine-1-phosphate N-acetyltransferase